MAKFLTLTKKEIEERTTYYVDKLGGRSGRRAIAARILGVSLRSIDAWCAPSDPRVIPADQLHQLVIEAHFRELYVANHIKIIDIYDVADVLIGSTNTAAEAAFLADVHCGRMTYRPREGRWPTPEIIMSEDKILRSRLRRVVASGEIDTKQISKALGCDEYVLIDMQSELNRFRFGRMPDRTGVKFLERYVSAQAADGWAA